MKIHRHGFYYGDAVFGLLTLFAVSVALSFKISGSFPIDEITFRIIWGGLSLLVISLAVLFIAHKKSKADYVEYKDKVISFPKCELKKSLEEVTWISKERPPAPTDNMPIYGRGKGDPSGVLCIFWQNEVLMIDARLYASFDALFDKVLADFKNVDNDLTSLTPKQIDALKYKPFNQVCQWSL